MIGIRFKSIARLGLLALALVFSAKLTLAQTILLESARVVPGDGSPVLENSALLVEGGTIARIGRKGEIGRASCRERV